MASVVAAAAVALEAVEVSADEVVVVERLEAGAVEVLGEEAAAVVPRAVASREAKQLSLNRIVTREFSSPEERKMRWSH